MASGERKPSGNSIVRAVFVALSVLLQIGWLLVIILELNSYSTVISLISSLLASLAVLRLYSQNTNSAFKLPWIMLMMALPVMGLSLYLMVGLSATPKVAQRKIQKGKSAAQPYLIQAPTVMAQLRDDPSVANQCSYLWNHTGSPAYGNTTVTYYPEAAEALEAMKADLERAEHFIFMEYFILEDREAFAQLREILVRKAREGVEVRLMYDDFGSIGYVNLKFARELTKEGIQCKVFNPALPVLNLFMNNRDHRKITVIDGKVGFTGGYNLANEYFGLSTPFGHWKDTGIRLEGAAVRSLTSICLELWHSGRKEAPGDPGRYLDICHKVPARGIVQPFGDDPLGSERVAENVYINMIGQARRYIYFMTPYLIITDELKHALGLAAKRGVDVRIITPGIPDKRTVYAVTRSYYAGLAGQGVRIYEYSPGFVHAKQCVCDGKLASIGTSNLDYRSLYLHFENDVLLYNCEAVEAMERDFLETFPLCREVTEKYSSQRSGVLRIWQCILRLFAPMM